MTWRQQLLCRVLVSVVVAWMWWDSVVLSSRCQDLSKEPSSSANPPEEMSSPLNVILTGDLKWDQPNVEVGLAQSHAKGRSSVVARRAVARFSLFPASDSVAGVKGGMSRAHRR